MKASYIDLPYIQAKLQVANTIEPGSIAELKAIPHFVIPLKSAITGRIVNIAVTVSKGVDPVTMYDKDFAADHIADAFRQAVMENNLMGDDGNGMFIVDDVKGCADYYEKWRKGKGHEVALIMMGASMNERKDTAQTRTTFRVFDAYKQGDEVADILLSIGGSRHLRASVYVGELSDEKLGDAMRITHLVRGKPTFGLEHKLAFGKFDFNGMGMSFIYELPEGCESSWLMAGLLEKETFEALQNAVGNFNKVFN